MIKILDWVLDRNIFMLHEDKWPNIRVKGRGVLHIGTFMAGIRNKPDGNLYLFTEERRYRDRNEMTALLNEIRSIGLKLANPANVNGSYLNRPVRHLKESEFEELLRILSKYTG